MKFIWRYIYRRLQTIGSDPDRSIDLPTAKIRASRDIESDEGLNITVRAAIGGKIVSFRHYDSKADRNYWKTYVIPDDLDFERELGKMITLESMRG